MKSKEPPKYGRKKQSHNKLRSEIKNTVVSAIIKYNEHNKIYNSCSLQLKQVYNCDKNNIAYSIEC